MREERERLSATLPYFVGACLPVPAGGHRRFPRSPSESLPPPRQECGAVAPAIPMCLSLALPALLAAAPRRYAERRLAVSLRGDY